MSRAHTSKDITLDIHSLITIIIVDKYTDLHYEGISRIRSEFLSINIVSRRIDLIEERIKDFNTKVVRANFDSVDLIDVQDN